MSTYQRRVGQLCHLPAEAYLPFAKFTLLLFVGEVCYTKDYRSWGFPSRVLQDLPFLGGFYHKDYSSWGSFLRRPRSWKLLYCKPKGRPLMYPSTHVKNDVLTSHRTPVNNLKEKLPWSLQIQSTLNSNTLHCDSQPCPLCPDAPSK